MDGAPQLATVFFGPVTGTKSCCSLLPALLLRIWQPTKRCLICPAPTNVLALTSGSFLNVEPNKSRGVVGRKAPARTAVCSQFRWLGTRRTVDYFFGPTDDSSLVVCPRSLAFVDFQPWMHSSGSFTRMGL